MRTLSAKERGDMAEQLLPIAAHLAAIVHGDGGPQDIQEVLADLDEVQRTALIVVLAGLVDPDQPMGVALGWLDRNEHGVLTVPVWEDRTPLRDLAPDPVLEDDETYIDPAAIVGYLQGRRVEVSPRERLAAIAEGVERGMQYPDFDRLHRLTKGSTSTFVSRTRRAYEERGEALPEALRAQGGKNGTSVDLVVRIRQEYAAGGVTDLELAMRYGLSRKTISNLLSGISYRDVGGPVRQKRENRPSKASRTLWAATG